MWVYLLCLYVVDNYSSLWLLLLSYMLCLFLPVARAFCPAHVPVCATLAAMPVNAVRGSDRRWSSLWRPGEMYLSGLTSLALAPLDPRNCPIS